MKTPITEVERRELEQKIQNVVGDTVFEGPWPEFFLCMGLSSTQYAAYLQKNHGSVTDAEAQALAELCEREDGRINIHHVTASEKLAAFGPWRDAVVCAVTRHGQHVLGRFRGN